MIAKTAKYVMGVYCFSLVLFATQLTVNAAQLTINVESQKYCRHLVLSVCKENEHFPPSNKKGCSVSLETPVKPGASRFIVILPKSGKYAVAGFCDEYNDKTLHKSWFGRPKEPYGASNYNGGIMPPTFSGSSIFIENEGSVVLKLIYP